MSKICVTTKQCEDGTINNNIQYSCCSMQNWRNYQEDEFIVSHYNEKGELISKDGTDGSYSIFSIFDGHGGKDTATYCKNHLNDFIMNYIRQFNSLIINQDILTQAFHDFDFELVKTHKDYQKELDEVSTPPDPDMDTDHKNNNSYKPSNGSTATIVILDLIHNKVHIAHIGDSRVIVFQKDKALLYSSRDHNPEEKIESKRLQDAMTTVNRPFKFKCVKDRIGVTYPEACTLNVCRGFGDWIFKVLNEEETKIDVHRSAVISTPDYFECPFSDSLYIYLASDGIWNSLFPNSDFTTITDQLIDWIVHTKHIQSSHLGESFDLLRSPTFNDTTTKATDNMTSICIELNTINTITTTNTIKKGSKRNANSKRRKI